MQKANTLKPIITHTKKKEGNARLSSLVLLLSSFPYVSFSLLFLWHNVTVETPKEDGEKKMRTNYCFSPCLALRLPQGGL